MKTTIDFPEELLHRAKVIAAQRRTTLRDLMVQALETVTSAAAEEEDADRKATFRRLLEAMKASNSEPMNLLSREEIYDR
jgi:predicted Zn-dependent protease